MDAGTDCASQPRCWGLEISSGPLELEIHAMLARAMHTYPHPPPHSPLPAHDLLPGLQPNVFSFGSNIAPSALRRGSAVWHGLRVSGANVHRSPATQPKRIQKKVEYAFHAWNGFCLGGVSGLTRD